MNNVRYVNNIPESLSRPELTWLHLEGLIGLEPDPTKNLIDWSKFRNLCFVIIDLTPTPVIHSDFFKNNLNLFFFSGSKLGLTSFPASDDILTMP